MLLFRMGLVEPPPLRIIRAGRFPAGQHSPARQASPFDGYGPGLGPRFMPPASETKIGRRGVALVRVIATPIAPVSNAGWRSSRTTKRRRPRFWRKIGWMLPARTRNLPPICRINNFRGYNRPDGHAKQRAFEPTLHPVRPSGCAGIFRASDLLGGIRLTRRRAGHRHAWRAGCRQPQLFGPVFQSAGIPRRAFRPAGLRQEHAQRKR